MDAQVVCVYGLGDDLLKALHHREDLQCRVSDAETLTTALTAACYLGGNFTRRQTFLFEQSYFSRCLSCSRFVR